MNISILCNGTRGDVQALVYLSNELKSRGSRVTISAGSNFRDLIEESGHYFVPTPVNLQDYFGSDEGKKLLKESSGNLIRFFREMKKIASKFTEETLQAYFNACESSDLIITTTGAVGDVYIARHYKVPLVEVQLQPLIKTGDFSYPLLNIDLKLGFLRKFSFRLIDFMLWQIFKRDIKRWHKSFIGDLISFKSGVFAQRTRDSKLILGGYSPLLVQKPSDWPEKAKITGFYRNSNPEVELSSAVTDFLEKGKPPIYIGFGSMSVNKKEEITSLLSEVLDKTDFRIMCCACWSKIDFPVKSERLLILDEVNHRLLFPLTGGIVHHGGAGTTAEALAAGIPQLILPFSADQPFWADRIYKAGVSVKPVKLKRKNIETIVSRISDFKSKELVSKSKDLSKLILNENGLKMSADLILDVMKN